MTSRTSIGILGLGAIGTVIASYLQSNASNALYYFSRTEKDHLKLITPTTIVNSSITVQTEYSQPIDLDWLVICLKANQYGQARNWLYQLIHPKTKVVVIRNGLYLKEAILEYTNEDHILECLIDCPTMQNENGFYEALSYPLLTTSKHKLALSFKSLFQSSEIQIQEAGDFKTESWKKLIESATLGGILCKYNSTCSIFKDLDMQEEYRTLLDESITVALVDGARIESDFSQTMLTKLLRYPETKGSSMLTDMRLGKPIEWNAKNGIIVDIAQQYHVPTPLNSAIIKQLKSQ